MIDRSDGAPDGHAAEMHPQLMSSAVAQGGVFTVQQARDAGYTDDEMRARLGSGRWIRVRHGIYRPAGVVDEFRLATAAALLACARSDPVASHRSAAVLLDLPLLDRPRVPELTLAERSATTSVKGCVIHRERVPAGERVATQGIRSTNAARTVVDLARTLSFAEAVVVADAALGAVLATPQQLAAAAAAVRGRPTYARMQRVLDFSTDRSASPGESLARTMFAQHGLPAPLLAQPIVVGGLVIAEVEFLWQEMRTIGEFDGRVKYLPGNDRGDDVLWQEKLREERLREAGFEVVRMTWAQVTREPHETCRRIRAAFGRQQRTLAAG